MIAESMNIKKKRDPFIDSLKGAAIILVVMGHVVGAILVEDQVTQNVLFRICYSFHMPLFMTISGFLTGGGVLLKTLNGLGKEHSDYYCLG